MPDDAKTPAEAATSADQDNSLTQRQLAFAQKAAQEARFEARRIQLQLDEANAALAKAGEGTVRPVAAPAHMRTRHWGLLASFILLVLLPVGLAAGYLYTRAADQYGSTMAFTVRSEDISSSAADLLGGIAGGLAGGGTSPTGTDSDILFKFIHSPDIVRRIDERIDLQAMFSRHHDTDPLFSFAPGGTIEDLTDYWQRMIRVDYDTTSHLMQVRALAFAPADARAITENIYAESSRTINELSDIARADSTRYAQEDLDTALERLKAAREAVTQFRLENQIVDVQADIQSQMGLLASLQGQQTEALIELDLLNDSTRPGDPRLDQAQRRLAVIEERIAEERRKFGVGAPGEGGTSYANTVSEYERLAVDREFAERAYVSALSAFDTAKAEASRQSRYLAAYITPTLAQKAEYPRREMILALIGLFTLLFWVIASLIFYALRERR